MSSSASPSFAYVKHMTGEHGLYEHALHDQPRIEHGYTTDDNARALVVIARAIRAGIDSIDAHPYLDFVLAGQVAGGWHNRMTKSGEWADLRGPDDSHGRAIWGLGEVTRVSTDERVVDALRAGVLSFESTHSRALAYAVLGAASALRSGVLPELMGDFLFEVSSRFPRLATADWPWPEPRLSYDNARLPEALLTIGDVLGDDSTTTDGLRLLEWLIETETDRGHFSFTPVGGRGADDAKPAFDQQPIEAWAMVDASHAAHCADPGDDRWSEAMSKALNWFRGENDAELAVYDPASGAGFDGLGPDAVNQNRGAESTLAALGSLLRDPELFSPPGIQCP